MEYSKEFYVNEAVKYALLLDDMALKSSRDQDRYFLGRAAKLLRDLGSKIKDSDNGEAQGSGKE